jgi:tRNA1(Val) A37 N6-methylase TrmN6
LDDFLGGRLRLEQPARGFRSGQDAILLAAAVPARPGDQVLELGAGAGAAILALGTRVPGLALTALELQPAYAALARSNAARNAFPLEVLEGDLRAPPESLRARAFDHVLLNPPYYDRSASTRASDPGRDLAHGGDAPVRAWLALAARRLRLRGTLTVIQRTARLPDLLAALPSGMGAAEVLPLAPRDGQPPARAAARPSASSRPSPSTTAPASRAGRRPCFGTAPPCPGIRQAPGESSLSTDPRRLGA